MIEIDKVIILGWDNFTASLAEGIKKKYPECEVLCTDPVNEQIFQAQQQGLLSALPSKKSLYKLFCFFE